MKRDTVSREYLVKLCKKYSLTTSGTKPELAYRLAHLRGEYLSKTERNNILPLIKKQSTRKRLRDLNERNIRKY